MRKLVLKAQPVVKDQLEETLPVQKPIDNPPVEVKKEEKVEKVTRQEVSKSQRVQSEVSQKKLTKKERKAQLQATRAREEKERLEAKKLAEAEEKKKKEIKPATVSLPTSVDLNALFGFILETEGTRCVITVNAPNQPKKEYELRLK